MVLSNHVLPVIRQPQFNEHLKEVVPNALFGPTVEAHIRPNSTSRSAHACRARGIRPENMHHALRYRRLSCEGRDFLPRWATVLDDPPFHIRQVRREPKPPPKGSLESCFGLFRNHSVNRT